MTKKIVSFGVTPVLEGKDAEEWWNKVKSEENIPFEYISTPKLEELRKEILAKAEQRKRKVAKIPFGELNLTLSQINKMAKTLWEDQNPDPLISWKDLKDYDKEGFIREFILPIPKVLATVGLKVVGK